MTISLLSIVFLVYYGSDTQWASRGEFNFIRNGLFPRVEQTGNDREAKNDLRLIYFRENRN